MGACLPACLPACLISSTFVRPRGYLVGSDLSEEIVRKRELAAAGAGRTTEGRGEERLGTYNIGRMKWKKR